MRVATRVKQEKWAIKGCYFVFFVRKKNSESATGKILENIDITKLYLYDIRQH